MSGSLKPAEFFVLEAGEYLERLATLVAKPDGPKPDELVRYARALRGSALMASQPEFAGAAGGVEALARAFRDGTIGWTAEVRESASHAVDQLKGLLRHAPQWSAADTAEAERIARDLGKVAGQPVPHPQRRAGETGQDLNTGVRAFVAREGALIASALERAARALHHDRGNMDPVHNVVRRMQSLRGLAELADLSPLPDVLDALELAAGDLTRSRCAPPGVSEVFGRGAGAMTRLSRDVADRGIPTPDSDEAVHFTNAIVAAFALEEDVVGIDSLAPEGEASLVTPGTATPLREPDGGMELVGHGEHLAELAHGLRRAASTTERRLRLYALIEALRAMGQRIGAALSTSVDAFLGEAKRLLDSEIDGDAMARFATVLQQAGAALGEGHASGATAARLEALTQGMDTPPTAPAPAIRSEPAVPLESAHDRPEAEAPADEFISIADLAPAPTPSSVAETPPSGIAMGLDAFPQTTADEVPLGVGLAGGLRSLAELRRDTPAGPPSIEAWLGLTTAEPVAAVAEAQPEEAVSIDTLLYRGDSAWNRASELRRELAKRLPEATDLGAIRPLVEELIDLLPLVR